MEFFMNYIFLPVAFIIFAIIAKLKCEIFVMMAWENDWQIIQRRIVADQVFAAFMVGWLLLAWVAAEMSRGLLN